MASCLSQPLTSQNGVLASARQEILSLFLLVGFLSSHCSNLHCCSGTQGKHPSDGCSLSTVFHMSRAEMCNPQTRRTKGVYLFRRCSHPSLLPPAQSPPVLAAYFFTKGKEVFEAQLHGSYPRYHLQSQQISRQREMKARCLEDDDTVFEKQRSSQKNTSQQLVLNVLESAAVHYLKTGVELLMTAVTCLCYTKSHLRLSLSPPFIPA